MSPLNCNMSRRTFIKMTIQLSTLIILAERGAAVADIVQTTTQATPYGAGAYGQGSYPGVQKIYLPFISKGGN